MLYKKNNAYNNAFIALLAEVENTELRESSVNATYRLLKKTNSDQLSPLLVQFSFWVCPHIQFDYVTTKSIFFM